MSNRINLSDLESIIKELNELTETPKDKEYRLQGAYGGYQLQKLIGDSGAVNTPLGGGFYTKRELFEKIRDFKRGIQL